MTLPSPLFDSLLTTPSDAVVWMPRADRGTERVRDVLGNRDRRDRSALVEADPARRKIRAVEQNRNSSCLGGVRHRPVGIDSGWKQRGTAGDQTGAAAVEEVEQWNRSAIAGCAARHRSRRTDPHIERVSRRHRPGERSHPVELDAKPRAQHDAHLSEARPKIHGADRQDCRCSARAGNAAVAGTCRTIVPGGSDYERVESSRTRGSTRDRAVGKTGERLRNADECDTRRVVRIAVAVRIDRSLEPGENLVRASVHRPARGRIALPPRNTDRQHRRARCNTRECAGPPGADQQTGHLRTVPLELSRLVRARSRQCAGLTTDDVDASRDATAQEGLGTIDTGIEQSDRHAAAVLVGEPDVRTLAELGARQQTGS